MKENIYTQKWLGVGGLMKIAWGLYREHLSTIFPIALAVYIPINIFLGIFTVNSVNESQAGLSAFSSYLRMAGWIQALVGILATAAIVYVIDQSLQGVTVTWKKALSFALNRWMRVITNTIKSNIVIGLLLILLIIPGIIWAIYYSFVEMIAILREDKDPLKVSKDLVKGQWWRVFRLSFVTGFISLVVSLGIGLVSGVVMPETNIIFDVITNTLTDIALSYFVVFNVVAFLHLEYLKKSTVAEKSPAAVLDNPQTV